MAERAKAGGSTSTLSSARRRLRSAELWSALLILWVGFVPLAISSQSGASDIVLAALLGLLWACVGILRTRRWVEVTVAVLSVATYAGTAMANVTGGWAAGDALWTLGGGTAVLLGAGILGKLAGDSLRSLQAGGWVALLALEPALRRALQRQELQVLYQPIVAVETGRIAGFEALVRWRHPKRGLLSPADFISEAEELGLILPLDLWVLREACRQTRQWQGQFPLSPPLTISVNLSAKHFVRPDVVQHIERALRDTGLRPASLQLEITERAIMEDTDSVLGILSQLRSVGVHLQLDDFGTGYSSLSRLHRFPIDALKVDRSFVCELGVDGSSSRIVRSIVALAHNLGMRVVAEGVETEEQLAYVRALGCQYAQGYLFSRPVNAEAARELIAEPQWLGRLRRAAEPRVA